MTQCERILKYLDEYGSITRAEAMNECGIANFTARISDLRRNGVALDVETVSQKNRYGENVRFARYRRASNGE
nr:MAG TPA: helix-turn-helix domain protein [Caudoviricetes sp.]